MRKYLFSTLAAVILAATFFVVAPAALAGDCSVANCREQGGARWHIGSGGSLDVESGGDIDIESGGALKLAGTTVTATATELNLIDGYTGTTAELNALDLTAAVGTSTASEAMVRDSSNVMDGVPLAETQSVDPSQKVTLFDDFLEGTIDASRWEDADGTDPQAIGPVIVNDSLNGEIVLTSGDVGIGGGSAGDTTALVDGTSVSGKRLNFQVDQGGLVMEARVKLTSVAESILFIGFIDEIQADSDVNLGMQATGTADVIDSDVTDSAGMIYDTSFQTSPTKLNMGGNKAAAVTAIVVGTVTPTNGTYFIVRVELSAAGSLEVFIDGTSIGTIANAITVNVALTPDITIATNDTTESVVTVDYIWGQQNR